MRQCFNTIKEKTKKIAVIVCAFLFVLSLSLFFITRQVFAMGNYALSLTYSEKMISGQFGQQYAGNENGTKRSGLLLTSKNHGTAAEGAGFAIDNTLSGEFSMDFRVISEQRYQLNPNRGNKYGYTHVMKDSNEAFNALASDNWNPYQDLKEVAFTFTSKSDPSKYFVVYINGTSSYQAFLCTAKVYVPGDHISLYNGNGAFETKGYGLNADGTTVYEPAYWNHTSLQQTLIKGTSFTNFVSYSEDLEYSPYLDDVADGLTRTFSNVVRFDPATMSVYVNGNGVNKYYSAGSYKANTLVRDIDDNTRFNAANGYSAASLDASYFADGYTVTVEFTDVTADNTVGSADYMYNPGQYNTIDTPYDRYAKMLIYSVNEISFNDTNIGVNVTKSDRTQQSFIKDVDDRLTVTANFKDTGNYTGTGLNIKSNVSGTAAEGASFTFADTMVGNFDTAFRVQSAKQYGYPTTGEGDQKRAKPQTQYPLSNEAFFADSLNPYNDLKEVKYEFISNDDPSQKFSVYFRGAMSYTAYGMGVAVTVGDNTPTRDKYVDVVGYSFSNFFCDNGGWDYATHALLPVRFTFEQDTMKVNVYGCSGYNRNEQGNQYVGDLSSLNGAFNNGYTVKVVFTDVTANDTIGNGADCLFDETNALYTTFDTAYDRYIDFSIYSLNGQSFAVEEINDETTPRATAKKSTFKAGQEFDATPLLYDATVGNNLPLTGKVYYSTDNAVFTEIENVNGSYVFTPENVEKYYIKYTGFSDGLTHEIAETIVEIEQLVAYTLTLNGEAKTYYEGEVVDLASFIEDKSKEHKVFAGFLVNDSKIYSKDYDLVMTADVKVDVYYVEFYFEQGASIRVNKETPGIRFVTHLSQYGSNVISSTFGVNTIYSFEITMQGGKTVTKDVTAENTMVDENGDITMCAAILGLTEDYYASVFECKFYVTVNYEDCKNAKIYALNDDNVRSAKQVAELALADETKEWSEEQLEIFYMYAGIKEEVQ